MAKKRKQVFPHCENCGFRTDNLLQRDDVRLCEICYTSMPGIYVVGNKGSTSLPAIVMRQNSFCANMILDAIKRMHGNRS